jgi:hypothetical protein
VTHADLGSVDENQALTKIVECGKQLEQIVSRPVLLFSFLFGGIHNIRKEIREMVMTSGYRALFSAHGGIPGQEHLRFRHPALRGELGSFSAGADDGAGGHLPTTFHRMAQTPCHCCFKRVK